MQAGCSGSDGSRESTAILNPQRGRFEKGHPDDAAGLSEALEKMEK